jgi:uncharacterized protein YkwD
MWKRARPADDGCVPTSAFARILLAAALVCAFAALAVGAGAATPARTAGAVDQLERHVLAELNEVRRAHGLRSLRLSAPLSIAADRHSRAMGRHGFFEHESRDGSSFWRRVKRFYGSRGYRSWSVGENLLWSTPGIDAARAVELWLKSPGHRRNILTPRWREIGLGAVFVRGAPGVFGGRDVVIITTDFGVRS